MRLNAQDGVVPRIEILTYCVYARTLRFQFTGHLALNPDPHFSDEF